LSSPARGARAIFQIRIHGRGGQGVVTAAEMLSVAAFIEDMYAQAFPSFGSERMGAPVMAFCRIDEREIRLREPVVNPDALIIQDPTLLHQVDLFSGLDTRGYLLINTRRGYRDLGLGDYVTRFPPHHICTVAATEWALEFVGRPLPNAALLGAFSALTRRVELESVVAAIHQIFPGEIGDRNAAAATKAYDTIRTN
jgi:pyruvate ferredoxin oxidoreductase gamma subunit